MYLVAIAWMYVVVMMAVAEATSANGSVLGAAFTFLLYGVLPLSIVMYLLRAPARRQSRRRATVLAADDALPAAAASDPAAPYGGDHPPGDAVAPVRKEP